MSTPPPDNPDPKSSGRRRRSRNKPAGDKPQQGENQHADNKQGGDSGRKKRRIRTKQCIKCMTPCCILTRCRLSGYKDWCYLCDICWPTYAPEDKAYVYGGTWTNGRVSEKNRKQGDGRKPDSQDPGDGNRRRKRKRKPQDKQHADSTPKPSQEGQSSPPRRRRRRRKQSGDNPSPPPQNPA